jgi:tetratricopeptide (TPR) repeat protein
VQWHLTFLINNYRINKGKNIKYLTALICIILLFSCERYGRIIDDRDMFFQIKFNGNQNEIYDYLKLWESNEPNNLDMYYHFYKYYFRKSIIINYHSEEEAKENKNIVSKLDINPETREIIGNIYVSFDYKEEEIINAFDYLNRGLSLFPNRLDFHLEKIYLLFYIEEYSLAYNSIISLIELSKNINNKWLTIGNRKIGKKAFLIEIQSIFMMWHYENKELVENIKYFAETLFEYYPNSVYSYYNFAIYYFMKGNYQEALKYYIQAEKINKKDINVLVGLGITYFEMGEEQKANDYVQKVMKRGGQSYMSYFQKYLNK